MPLSIFSFMDMKDCMSGERRHRHPAPPHPPRPPAHPETGPRAVGGTVPGAIGPTDCRRHQPALQANKAAPGEHTAYAEVTGGTPPSVQPPALRPPTRPHSGILPVDSSAQHLHKLLHPRRPPQPTAIVHSPPAPQSLKAMLQKPPLSHVTPTAIVLTTSRLQLDVSNILSRSAASEGEELAVTDAELRNVVASSLNVSPSAVYPSDDACVSQDTNLGGRYTGGVLSIIRTLGVGRYRSVSCVSVWCLCMVCASGLGISLGIGLGRAGYWSRYGDWSRSGSGFDLGLVIGMGIVLTHGLCVSKLPGWRSAVRNPETDKQASPPNLPRGAAFEYRYMTEFQ
eukprot:gene31562-6750_t